MGDFFQQKLDMWLGICFLFILISIGVGIYAIVLVTKLANTLDTRVLEMKSKIGSIIREVNNINRLEYQVNASQDQKINRLSPQTTSA